MDELRDVVGDCETVEWPGEPLPAGTRMAFVEPLMIWMDATSAVGMPSQRFGTFRAVISGTAFIELDSAEGGQ